MFASMPYSQNFAKALSNGERLIELNLLGWTSRETVNLYPPKVRYMDIAAEIIQTAVENKVDFKCDRPRDYNSAETTIAMRTLSQYYGAYYIRLCNAWFDAYSTQ